MLDESMLLLHIKLLANIDTLLNVIVNFPLNFRRQLVLVSQLLESLKVLAFLQVLSTDVANQSTDPVDIVSQTNHANNFNKNKTQSLSIVSSHNIPKSNSQHYVHSPIVPPYVLLKPRTPVDVLARVPVVVGINTRHSSQKNSKNMRKAEVKEKHLRQRPVLLIMIRFYKENLQFLHLLQTLRQLSHNK